MSSLADLPELVGFFSYSREDDADSHGALSAQRSRIQGELRGQLGRTARTFRLWQDKEAIPSGTLWKTEIKNAVAQSVFFIPIITPTVVASPYCRFELESFLAREAALGRADLVFPILYIDVPALEDAARRQNDPVLSLIANRQYVDWREFRYLDVNSTEVKRAVGRFCADIRDALQRSWVSPEERKSQEEAAALERAEAKRKRREAEAEKRRDEEAGQKAAEEERRKREEEAERQRADEQRRRDEAEAQRSAEEEVRQRATVEERLRREAEVEKRRKAQAETDRREAEAELQRAEAEQRKADNERRRQEAETKPRAEEEERPRSQPPPSAWQKPRPLLLIGSLLGVVALVAIGVWLAVQPAPVPAPPTPPAPVTQTPASVTPREATDTPLSPTQEQALKPGDTFQECTNCPKIMVVPAGSFTMGSPANEPGRGADEGPQHTVTFARQFAVGQFELTFDEWDACVADDGCNGYKPDTHGWGRGRRPVINVSWDDATAYVAWLAKLTGKPYRLLSESEYEYATRAGMTTAYPWGDAIGTNNANCDVCGDSQWGGKQTAPVGSFAPNQFGLYDMVGNVWEWTQDCYHNTYDGAPADGLAWTGGDCSYRVLRGGSWDLYPQFLHSAFRLWITPSGDLRFLRSALRLGYTTDYRSDHIGFRVARTLLTP